MSLISIEFALFLLGAVAALQIAPCVMKPALLAGLNLVFFYCGSGLPGTVVLLFVLAIIYVTARLLSRNEGDGEAVNEASPCKNRRRLVLCIATVLVALSPLLVFKYAGPIMASLSSLLPGLQADGGVIW